MAGQFGGTPVLILKEGSQRTAGREAQKSNIMAAKAVAGAVRTTLGPKGMDKMLVDTLGDVVITNDGVTILKEMDIEHPAAKMMVEIAKTQDAEVGDGTTTAVVLAGELLKQAEGLLDQEIHPTVIAAGYRAAADKSLEILKTIGVDISVKDDAFLKKIAITAMTGKGSGTARESLADLAVKAVTAVVDEDGSVDTDNITVEKKVGGGITDSELVHGMVIDKDRLHPNMPKKVTGAKIALLNAAIEIEKTEVDAKIEITSPDQLQAFLDQEETMLKGMVDAIKATGANVVFCQKGIDDLAQHFLANAGIYTVRRVKKSDMEKLARATGGRIVTSIHDLSAKDLGKAGLVEERKIGD
ncbi:MAG TPA: thermosome subunit beta, partial [Methanothrix sp.]|nr:thermosome subunit beta [Methanothrix sp.]